MAIYYGRRYYRRYPRRSSRRAYTSRSRFARRTRGNQRAAAQQKDQGEVVLNIPSKLSAFNGTINLNVDTPDHYEFSGGVYALNIWDIMRKSEFYQSYANMYDQVKINKVTVKLTPYQFPIVSFGVSQGIRDYYNSYTVVTAWDRTGLSQKQLLYRFVRDEVNSHTSINFISNKSI